MKKSHRIVQILVILVSIGNGESTSWLCGRVKTMELGGGGTGTEAALALTLVRPRRPPSDPPGQPPSCKLRINAPNAAYLLLRIIDVKESLLDAELSPVLSALGGAGGVAVAGAAAAARKWSARAAPAQDTVDRPAAPSGASNNTEPCTLSVYVPEAPLPMWRLNLCGGAAAAVAARAGSMLVLPRIKVVWTPPVSSNHHTEKLRLVVTAVNSGAACANTTQFSCGALSVCVASTLVCDGVRNCPGGEDEDRSTCARRREPPLLELVRILSARSPELLGVEAAAVTRPSVIMKIGETEQKASTLTELTEALKPYGPWGYIMMGVLMCATMIMFVVVWAECCCKRSKPDEEAPDAVPAACADLSVAVTAASRDLRPPPRAPTPPAYEPPPSYSSLFPRAFKSSPTPVPHCSHQPPPD